MYNKLDKCPLCKSTKFKNLIICKDHFLSGESFAISYCEQCKLEFTNPRPADELLHKYYQSAEYISHSNKATTLQNKVYKLIRKYTIKQKVKSINQYVKKSALLDYGCGTGEFLSACKQDGWKVTGIEPEIIARDQAHSLVGDSLYDNINNMLKDVSYDAITLWHVLEHVPDLNFLIRNLKRILTHNGIIFVAVPNNHSWDAKHYKEFWAAYDIPRHLYHFNQESFKNLCEIHSLKIISIIPMKFDSYYVSLLSEKYKFQKNNYLKSIINGSLSNNYARLNQNNYSSLIYILKK